MTNWTPDLVILSAKKYTSRSEWKKSEPGAYKAAIRFKCMVDATNHMSVIKKDWTLEELMKNAKPFKTRSEWKNHQPAAYKTAMVRKILDLVCAHMVNGKNPNGTWTKENVLASAKAFNSIAAWANSNISAYNVAKKKGWMTEATGHMAPLAMPIGPSLIHKYLISHEIPYLAEKRFSNAPLSIRNKPFDFFVPSLNLVIEYHGKQHHRGWRDDPESLASIQHNDQIKKEWAISMGLYYLEIKSWESKGKQSVHKQLAAAINKYAEFMGVDIRKAPRDLTNNETFKTQSGLAFDKDDVLKEAKKYKTRSEWLKMSPRTYRFARLHGLDAEATSHMKYITQHGKWTIESIIENAKLYSSYSEWRKNEASAYVVSRRLDCSDLIKRLFLK